MPETENKIVEDRKKKIIKFLKKPQVWLIFFLIVVLILGIYIRSLPMQVRSDTGKPGLWDITTNTWTLGPDLDPWLFVRQAGEIIGGDSPKIDYMRNTPIGFDNTGETMVLPKMIALTYKISRLFYSQANIEFAGDIFPVIMFALTIIAFFLFVREIFIKEKKTKANIIALISTFFMVVVPSFLPRTIAGIPEKESAGFFFIFLTYFFFLKAWRSEDQRKTVVFATLAGISTILMSSVWGGVLYIYIPIAASTLIAFGLNKIRKRELSTYMIWIGISIIGSMTLFPNRYGIGSMLASISISPAIIVFFIITIDLMIWKTKLRAITNLEKIKLPRKIISLIISIVILAILGSLVFGINFIPDTLQKITGQMFKPVTGRWNTTVAENRQPFFDEWEASFGPFFKGIALMFWGFLIGAILLFKNMLKKINKKDSLSLTIAFAVLLFGMIFSRYSPSSVLNGENAISKIIYAGAIILFLTIATKKYLKSKEKDKFREIEYPLIFAIVLLLLGIFSARGAVRLIMVLGPISTIFLSYLIWESTNSFFKTKDSNKKMIFGIIAIIVIVGSVFIFQDYYSQTTIQAKNMIPSIYNQQWQKAMSWVRENTPETIIKNGEFQGGTVFSHWWDYGYWVQSIGKRATVLDGGNAALFWNYWMGRVVLTGDNQQDALNFLYAHNTTHFLIDSTDIVKYGAYSQIGSDENYDRISWIGSFLKDESQTQETNNMTFDVYTGGVSLDEDIKINQEGAQVFLPSGKTTVGAIIIPYKTNGQQKEVSQPYAVMIYNNQQTRVNLRYLKVGENFIDFQSGIEATAFIIPEISVTNKGVNTDPYGTAVFISPRLMRGMMAQVYLLGDPLKKFSGFKLVHTEQNMIIDSLNMQGMNLPEFVYYSGSQNPILGPIKIWEIEYTGEEKVEEKYLDKDSSRYLNWQL